MGKWWKFGRGKDQEQAPAPAPQAPAPPPTPTAPESSGTVPPKRGGLLGRLFGRGKKKEEGPKEEAPPAEPAGPPAPPAPPSPPVPPAEGPGEGGGEGEGEGEEEGKKEPERVYPNSLTLSVSGTWVISDSVWHGTISGTLTGADVKVFIDAVEKGKEDVAIRLLARAYDDKDMGFARYLDTKASSWDPIIY